MRILVLGHIDGKLDRLAAASASTAYRWSPPVPGSRRSYALVDLNTLAVQRHSVPLAVAPDCAPAVLETG